MELVHHDLRIALIDTNPNSNLKVIECSVCGELEGASKECETVICWRCIAAKAPWPSPATPTPSRVVLNVKICDLCKKKLIHYVDGWKCPDKVLKEGLHAGPPEKIRG